MYYYHKTTAWREGKGWLVHGSDFLDMDVIDPPEEFWEESIGNLVKLGQKHFGNQVEMALLPDGVLVFLQLVGMNASHEFYVGQSQNGCLYRATCGDEKVDLADLESGEWCEYLGDDGERINFSVNRMWIRAIGKDEVSGSYWGHV